MKSNSTVNGMWTENKKIHQAISDARAKACKVRHRVSVPDFERLLGGGGLDKDKPITAYLMVRKDDALRRMVQALFEDLHGGDEHDPSVPGTTTEEYMTAIRAKIDLWEKECAESVNVVHAGKVVIDRSPAQESHQAPSFPQSESTP